VAAIEVGCGPPAGNGAGFGGGSLRPPQRDDRSIVRPIVHLRRRRETAARGRDDGSGRTDVKQGEHEAAGRELVLHGPERVFE